MALENSSNFYQPLPQDNNPNQHHQNQNYDVLTVLIPVADRRRYRRILISAFSLLLFATALYITWPSRPHLSVVRLRLSRLHVGSVPHVSLDITLGLTVKVHNPDVYSLNYNSLSTSIWYRGEQLGFVKSNGGEIRARGSSYVNATLDFDGLDVLSDAILLIKDVANGLIPFDTVTEVEGQLGLFLVDLPLKAKVLCEVDVNTSDHTIIRQNCYPEVSETFGCQATLNFQRRCLDFRIWKFVILELYPSQESYTPYISYTFK